MKRIVGFGILFQVGMLSSMGSKTVSLENRMERRGPSEMVRPGGKAAQMSESLWYQRSYVTELLDCPMAVDSTKTRVLVKVFHYDSFSSPVGILSINGQPGKMITTYAANDIDFDAADLHYDDAHGVLVHEVWVFDGAWRFEGRLENAYYLEMAKFDQTGERIIGLTDHGGSLIWVFDSLRGCWRFEAALPDHTIYDNIAGLGENNPLLDMQRNSAGTLELLGVTSINEDGSLKDVEWRVSSMAIDPTGKRVATGTQGGRILVWTLKNEWQIEAVQKGHTCAVSTIVFDETGQRIVSGSEDGTTRVWTLEDSNLQCKAIVQREASSQSIKSAVFNSFGTRMVLIGEEFPAEIWALETPHPRKEEIRIDQWVSNIANGKGVKFFSAALNAPGTRMVTCGYSTADVWVLDGITWRCEAQLVSYQPLLPGYINFLRVALDAVVRVALFDETGQRILTDSQDGKIRIWENVQGEGWKETMILKDRCRYEPQRGENRVSLIKSATFNKTGKVLILVYQNGRVQVWQLGSTCVHFCDLPRGSLAFFDNSGMNLAVSYPHGEIKVENCIDLHNPIYESRLNVVSESEPQSLKRPRN